jgi:hypothetical protein
VSRSRFLGREPAETTAYHYNRRGQVIKTVTTREPEWLDDDRAWLMALLAEESERCSGCGQLLSECMDPGTAKTWELVERTCQACLILDVARDNDAEAARNGSRRRGVKRMVQRQE